MNLFLAYAAGNLEDVKTLLKDARINVHELHEDRKTAFWLACWLGRTGKYILGLSHFSVQP
jgi:hypothetical protein